QFATHNALTVATILTVAEQHGVRAEGFEFQRLHGMGESLHDQLVSMSASRTDGGLAPKPPPQAVRSSSYTGPEPSSVLATHNYRVRIYAPVGAHKDLLAYLIRRLLENGANSSFVHLLMDKETAIDDLTVSPLVHAQSYAATPNSITPLPVNLYGEHRPNPLGLDFGYRSLRTPFMQAVEAKLGTPKRPNDIPVSQVAVSMLAAQNAFAAWDKTPVNQRADILRRAADLLDARRAECVALCMSEAKKTYADSISEIREAIDFCRYYANEAERIFVAQQMPGPTGESNILTLHGRGVFVCISPWNFPLAIFIGQVAAALVCGNSVVAKPAEQTPAIAAAAVALLHEAGVPNHVLQLVCGDGETVGAALVAAPQVAGVCFTGSTMVAKTINRALAKKDGPIVPLIAETGGMNAMIVDSSALLEQACDDIITSAFGSAGQRCSSLRLLFVQQEVVQHLCELLMGAMDELRVGDTQHLVSDIGPVIDRDAQQKLLAHVAAMKPVARFSHTCAIPLEAVEVRVALGASPQGGGLGAMPPSDNYYVPPTLLGLDSPAQVTEEMFGPILHVFSYKAKELPKILAQIHGSGYGLTFGLHTRLRGKLEEILEAIPAGNRYVNRSMTGAVVGVQPFGGEG
ncbi:MAG: L-glutamate gamma-semialdehyde dehydrogenase, partial [Rickettsiales bacterium]|nr:L-glutamate gamma-semialdehyde dehydrogenase [Rickettsiales bacterium]